MTWIWRIEEIGCTGCGICADVCSVEAILMTREMSLPEPILGRCTGCMSCVKECPFDAVIVKAGDDQIGRQSNILTTDENGWSTVKSM